MRKLVKGAVAAGKAAHRVSKSSDKKAAVQQEAGNIGAGVGQAIGGALLIPGAARAGKKIGRKLGEKAAKKAASPEVQSAVRSRLSEFHGSAENTPTPGGFTPTPSNPNGPKNPFAD